MSYKNLDDEKDAKALLSYSLLLVTLLGYAVQYSDKSVAVIYITCLPQLGKSLVTFLEGIIPMVNRQSSLPLAIAKLYSKRDSKSLIGYSLFKKTR
jgi:hypothetical protein